MLKKLQLLLDKIILSKEKIKEMKDTIKVWNIRFLVMGLLSLVIGNILLKLNLEEQTTLIVSLLDFVVCLFFCLSIKQVKNNIEVVETPIIIMTINGYTINYDIKGIRYDDIVRCKDALNDWKKEHEFSFIYNRGTALVAQFKDTGKTEIEIIEVPSYQNTSESLIEYSGIFSYYMKNGVRQYKVDDIQLGELSFGVIDNIDDYANKKCHLWLLREPNNKRKSNDDPLDVTSIVGINVIGG